MELVKKKMSILLFLKLHQFKQKNSRNIEFYCKPAWFQNQVHGTNSNKQKIVQILSECYRLNYLSFELLHVVPHAIVQMINSLKSQ